MSVARRARTVNAMSVNRPYSLDNFPGIYSNRVFVGGAYRGIYVRVLQRISEAVIEAGFTPVNSSEFGIPEDIVRDYCEVILKQCKFAIFEVTIEAGWMSEFRDAYHYHVICLCLYDKRKWADWKIKRMSQMVTSDKLFKENNFGYLNMREMQTAVNAFLSKYRLAAVSNDPVLNTNLRNDGLSLPK